MTNRMIALMLGAAGMAISGCAYQGHGSSYGHSAHATYNPYGASHAPYRQQTKRYGSTRIEFEGSHEQFVDGNIIDGGATVGGNTYNEVAYEDAFKPGYRASVGLARDFSPNSTFTVEGFYKEAEAEDSVAVASNGGGAVNAKFSDYTSYGAELGLRQYLGAPNTRLRPYIGATAGAAYIEDINLEGPGVTGAVNEAGWVATASATGGFEIPVSPSASLALESGIRWEGEQDRAAFGASLGDDNSRFSVPVTLRGSFRF